MVPNATRESVHDAASTLAYHWAEGAGGHKDRLGVERLIRAYPIGLQIPLCANVLLLLQERGWYTHADKFEGLLFEMAATREAV